MWIMPLGIRPSWSHFSLLHLPAIRDLACVKWSLIKKGEGSRMEEGRNGGMVLEKEGGIGES